MRCDVGNQFLSGGDVFRAENQEARRKRKDRPMSFMITHVIGASGILDFTSSLPAGIGSDSQKETSAFPKETDFLQYHFMGLPKLRAGKALTTGQSLQGYKLPVAAAVN